MCTPCVLSLLSWGIEKTHGHAPVSMTLCVYGSTFVCLSLCVCLYRPYGCACLCICECGSSVSCLCMLTSTSFQHGVGYSTHTGLRLPAVGRHGTRRGLLMALDPGFVIQFNWTTLRNNQEVFKNPSSLILLLFLSQCTVT